MSNKIDENVLNMFIEQLKYIKRWLTPDDLESEFDIGLEMQRKLRSKNEIPFSKIGTKKIFYDRFLINSWLENHSISIKAC